MIRVPSSRTDKEHCPRADGSVSLTGAYHPPVSQSDREL